MRRMRLALMVGSCWLLAPGCNGAGDQSNTTDGGAGDGSPGADCVDPYAPYQFINLQVMGMILSYWR